MLLAPPTFVITNLRLDEYNGLHLVLLNHIANPPARCIVHTDRPDFVLLAEAQDLGAFFERTDRLAFALPAYLASNWPTADRRNPRTYDRRTIFRGGRRAADVDLSPN